MKYCNVAISVLLGLCLTACDDGQVLENTSSEKTEGVVVKLTGPFTGVENWSSQYTVALAGFGEDADYPEVQKNLPTDGSQTVVLTNIPSTVKTLEVCVTNRLRKRIVTLQSADFDPLANDTIRLSVSDMNLGQFNAIQQNVFNTTCANCHGASNKAAAGLFLTEGKAYEYLVGKTSSKNAEMQLVNPGNSSQSMLYQVLTTEVSKAWHYDHTGEVINTDIQTLIQNWINGGALE